MFEQAKLEMHRPKAAKKIGNKFAKDFPSTRSAVEHPALPLVLAIFSLRFLLALLRHSGVACRVPWGGGPRCIGAQNHQAPLPAAAAAPHPSSGTA